MFYLDTQRSTPPMGLLHINTHGSGDWRHVIQITCLEDVCGGGAMLWFSIDVHASFICNHSNRNQGYKDGELIEL